MKKYIQCENCEHMNSADHIVCEVCDFPLKIPQSITVIDSNKTVPAEKVKTVKKKIKDKVKIELKPKVKIEEEAPEEKESKLQIIGTVIGPILVFLLLIGLLIGPYIHQEYKRPKRNEKINETEKHIRLLLLRKHIKQDGQLLNNCLYAPTNLSKEIYYLNPYTIRKEKENNLTKIYYTIICNDSYEFTSGYQMYYPLHDIKSIDLCSSFTDVKMNDSIFYHWVLYGFIENKIINIHFK